MNTYAAQIHPIPPLCAPDARVLILGSFPSVKSREAGFFYGHPQNRFWRVLTAVLDWPDVPATISEKRTRITESRIALWDVIASCEIVGSSDTSIRSVVPNDLRPILETCEIKRICCNGTTAHQLYMRHLYPVTGRSAIRLPSTSPANASFSLPRLAEEWSILREFLSP